MTQDNGQTYSLAKRPLHQLTEAERATIAHIVLDRYVNGEQVAAIAPSFGVSDVTIYALLIREHQAAWKDIQTARALARLERAQDALRLATDAISLARERELVRSAQWELERLLARLYSPKQEIVHHGATGPAFTVIVSSAADALTSEVVGHSVERDA